MTATGSSVSGNDTVALGAAVEVRVGLHDEICRCDLVVFGANTREEFHVLIKLEKQFHTV